MERLCSNSLVSVTLYHILYCMHSLTSYGKVVGMVVVLQVV